MVEFPRNFFWGAATSAYQVEGNNVNSDWWEWEKRVGLRETSAEACRHYALYKEDFNLARQLNHNAHRLSIEWSRIEPRQGKFCQKELDHYRDVILFLRQINLEPIVTLHHFTNPLWFARLGGWQNKKAPKYFLRYVEKVLEVLGDKVNFWVTINEPTVYIYHGFILGIWPPNQKSLLKAKIVRDNFAVSHMQAYRLIHTVYKKKGLPCPLVGFAQHMQAFVPRSPSLKNKFAVYLRNRLFNFDLIERLTRRKALDFIGVNYYSRSLVGAGKSSQESLPLKKNSLGWDIYPEGLYNLLIKLKKYRLPLFILENGVCTEDDNLRWEFIYGHLKNIHLAIREGAKVLGYIYWSLIDNFEWDKGFGPRFGLIEVDYQNCQRKIRESARKFALVCKTGRLN
ncbi:MAG: glycoside hydrolase family 1 protein, partial [Candidatus Omnitrophota bacterium]|nr:glycoside hydrolase family 1 protein [Candidatus Omnitrophota bacterium]